MKKQLEFNHLISPFIAENNGIGLTPKKLVQIARFQGIVLWAAQNGIHVACLEDLNRVGDLRVNQALQDPSLIPLPPDKGIEDTQTKNLAGITPQNVQDSLFQDVRRHGWDHSLVRGRVVRHLVDADFIHLGLHAIGQNALNGDGLSAMSIREVVETRMFSYASEQPRPGEKIRLENVITREDIPSTLGPFEYAPDYQIRFPPKVIDGLSRLVEEHARVFSQFVPGNNEGHKLAYQHCVRMTGGHITEPFFQVDIAGLSQELLTGAGAPGAEDVINTLRDRIFEFEPSIAMYGLIETLGGGGLLGTRFREQLDIIRAQHQKPIVLLAPTREKLEDMRETEFGKVGVQDLTSEEVFQISGFNDLWGPDEFLKHLEQDSGQCNCLLYVRPSDPISKLKDPTVGVENPLLVDPNLRRIIRENALTLNIDDPGWPIGDPKRLKDSKVALPLMAMGFRVDAVNDVVASVEGEKISVTKTFNDFMNSRGLSQLSAFRVKPLQGVFGGYGQKTMNLFDRSNISWLKEMLALRGPYLIQPEIESLVVNDSTNGATFAVMDRAFFSLVRGSAEFMGGIRILVPSDSEEAHMGRLHGTREMISAPISS